jgi:diguanylate cyclase (GGDEF)-like protein
MCKYGPTFSILAHKDWYHLMVILKQERSALVSRVFTALLLLLTMAFFIPLILHFGVALKPVVKFAENGQLRLMSHDLNQNKAVGLGGKWMFFDNRFVQPNNIQSLLPEAREIQGTGGWQLVSEGTNKINGYGTYHLLIELESQTSHLAIQIPHIDTSYRLFLNNTLVASAGELGMSEQEAKPEYKPNIVFVPTGMHRFSLTLHVSSYHSSWGGLWAPIVIGDVDAIYAAKRDSVALSMFIIGALMLTIASNLIQYYFRPSEKIPLAFASLCMVFLCREFTAEHMYFVMSFLGVGFTSIVKLNYLTFYIGMPIVLCFISLYFPSAFNRKISLIFYAVAACFSLFVFFSPTRIIGYSLLSYQVFCLMGMIYMLSCLIIATKYKHPAADTMLLSFIILSLFSINDMLYALDILATGRFFSLGIVGFIISQSYVIGNRYNQIISNNETLSEQLQQRNDELQELGGELEAKVEKRTVQLELANRELNNLANLDNLTGALNRHGLHQHLQSAFDRLRRNREPSSIILFDFDNFKHINDTYGHDRGDKVLALSAKIIQDVIREQDKLARWGGEEFLVCLPDTDITGAIAIADKLRLAIANQLAGELAENHPITVTGGVAEIKSDETFEILFKRADNALYRGKRMGRNCIES